MFLESSNICIIHLKICHCTLAHAWLIDFETSYCSSFLSLPIDSIELPRTPTLNPKHSRTFKNKSSEEEKHLIQLIFLKIIFAACP